MVGKFIGWKEAAAHGKRRPTVLLGGILVTALLIGGGLYYWLSTRNIESTDDAYTDGRAITIAPQVLKRHCSHHSIIRSNSA